MKFANSYRPILAAFLIMPIEVSHAQSFSLSRSQFTTAQKAFEAKNGGDIITKCSPQAGMTVCQMTDKAFKKTAANMKATGLIRGSLTARKSIAFTETDGKLSSILLMGSREDPVNLFDMIGLVGGTYIVLGGKESETTKLVMDLGLMRGDDDPTVGTPKSVRTPAAFIACITQHSSASMAITCKFDPLL